MNQEYAIELRKICKTFKVEVEDSTKTKSMFNRYPTKTIENKVLDNISLQIKRGEVLGIIGLNGSGKSTLLSIMAKIMEPDTGTITVNGKVSSILELGMGFHPDLSGRENIYIKGEMYGFTRKQIDERIEDIIDFSGIRNYIDNPLRTYSSGMSGRLAFSIMVNVDAEIMLLDEIMSTGDPSFTTKANILFNKQLKNGKTVVFASQNIGQIEQLCTRAIWIDKGKIVAEGPTKNVCTKFQNTINESLGVITDLANNGVAEAQYKLALFYRDGNKIEKNENMYREWLCKSATNGFVPAQIAYADILITNKSENDRIEALAFYESAAIKGNAEAKLKLSGLANNSKNVKDLEEIRDILHQLAELGHPTNKFQYAMLMLRTAWNDKDRTEAIYWFKEAIKDGNPDAMFQLALIYRDGIGSAKDLNKYTELLTQAAELGHPDSIKQLAEQYLNGKIISKNEELSFKYSLESAKLGNAAMQYQVAIMYRDGIGVNPNKEESKKWFSIYSNSTIANYQYMGYEQLKLFPIKTNATPMSLLQKAASAYHLRAITTLAAMYRGDFSDAPNIEKSKELYEIAAKWPGTPRLTLADMYYRGVIFEQNYNEAAKLYEKLSYLCDANIDYRLYNMYINGLGFKKDEERAMYFLKRSASRGNQEAQRKIRSINSKEI